MSAPSPRRVAFDVLRQVTGDDAYANLALAKRLATAGLDPRDAALATRWHPHALTPPRAEAATR